MPRLWIFDWDGTLADSLGRIEQCMAAALVDAGLPEPEPAVIRNIIGLGLAEAIAALCPQAGALQRQQVRDHYVRRFMAADQQPCPLHTGAEALLQSLHGHGDVLAIATGKSRRGLDRVLAAHGLAAYFSVTRCADESVSKPAPDMVLELLALTGGARSRAVMVGDTEYDLAMAAAAGVAAIGVTFGAHAPERLLRHQPLACVDRLAQLLEWRDAIGGGP